MSVPGALDVAVLATAQFERLGIPYAIVGSVASSLHGAPRATLDVDVILRLRSEDVPPLCAALEEDFFVQPEALHESIRHAEVPSNAIHRVAHVKLDMYVRKDEGIHTEELGRARRLRLTGEAGSEAKVASPEYTVLQKLAWFRKSGEVSDRQWGDVLGVLKTQGANLDPAYLSQWAPRLGVLDLLERASREAGLA